MIWRNGNWYLGACYKEKTQRAARTKQPETVALDPGVRSFISFYSPHYSGNIGIDTGKKMFKHLIALDNLYSRISKSRNAKKKRSKIVRAMMELSFYTFRKRLEWIALKKGCCVVNRKLGSAKTISN